ncbi:CLUMA_CG000485, isoform A [Clunio marinus]|uniref:CLUMA_CG000485, isoform A n=1 Tax=Clunio marinus TaxID=568069 RepID=A0A1J1HK77_9DIPT|nr:CLUMA_CG000485, isoform A [Clunio marinus]
MKFIDIPISEIVKLNRQLTKLFVKYDQAFRRCLKVDDEKFSADISLSFNHHKPPTNMPHAHKKNLAHDNTGKYYFAPLNSVNSGDCSMWGIIGLVKSFAAVVYDT